MFSYLCGQCVEGGEGFVIVETNGIGYHVFVTPPTAQTVLETGDAVKLYTHLHLRDTGQELYGFRTPAERMLFQTLLSVSGVGPKTALTIMGVAAADVLRDAIAEGDYSLLTKVSGIGSKTAKKIVVELSEVMPTLDAEGARREGDAIDALTRLGYSQREAREALRNVDDAVETIEERVKEALKLL